MSRALLLGRRSLLALAAFALFACGSDTPVPEYPFPRQAPLEETDLAQYIVDEDAIAPDEEEEWDDGLSDEDLQMGAPEETDEAPEEAEQPEADAEEGDG